jgi:hypothetical protein
VAYFYSHQFRILPSPFNLNICFFYAHECCLKGADMWGCLCILFSELWLFYYACPNLGGVYYHSAGLRLLNDKTSFLWSHCLSLWIIMTDFNHEGVYFCSEFFLCVPNDMSNSSF